MNTADRSQEPRLEAPSHPAAKARASSAPRDLRAVATVLHRYVGLALASFLFVVGVTGTALAFRHELEAVISPELFRAAPPSADAELLDPIDLRERLQAQLPPGSRITYLPLEQHEGKAMLFFADLPAQGGVPGDDEFLVDPYTGDLLGSRRWGDLGQGKKNIVPFIYRLHWGLALGDVGMYLLGVVALLWTFDCFVGAYLTFPPRRSRRARTKQRRDPRVWFGRWGASWLLNTTKTFSLVFTWHRASGLWLWGILLVFAWSSVGLNLREVYNPAMAAAFGATEPRPYDRLEPLPTPRTQPALSWPEGLAAARARAAEEAERRGFDILGERGMDYYADRGMYRYWLWTTLDVSDTYPRTKVWIDGDTGALVGFVAPTGENAGQTVNTWLVSLHFAAVAGGGLPYRIFVALLGLAVSVLGVTGVWIWWRKRGKRRKRHREVA